MAKAFIEGMKGIPANLEKHFENATNKVIEVMRDPHATLSDYRDAIDYVEQEFKNACQETGTTASNAARDEFEDHVLKGLNKEDLQRWFEHKARAVKDLAEKARETGPKAWRFMSLKVLGAIAALGVALTVISGVLQSHSYDERRAETERWDHITRDIKASQAFAVDMETYKAMVRGLEEPPLGPLPMVVAAEAERPVQVETTGPSGTQRITSNIGRVYRILPPETQQEIERQASDHRDQDFHKDFTVNSPLGSAHFKY